MKHYEVAEENEIRQVEEHCDEQRNLELEEQGLCEDCLMHFCDMRTLSV